MKVNYEFLLPSPVETFNFYNRKIYIKRDDKINPLFSGNKYRKLHSYFDQDLSNIAFIISYGGIQSNAMLSIASFAFLHNLKFFYIVKSVPSFLKENPHGNYAKALEFGMKVIEKGYDNFYDKVEKYKYLKRSMFINQGGADDAAKDGVEELSREIVDFMIENQIEKLNVITPSGTGTTSFYLAYFLSEMANIYTTPTVAGKENLINQMKQLGDIPNINIIDTKKRFKYAKPYKEFLNMYHYLKNFDIDIDLIYAPKTLIALKENLKDIDGDILYIHSGGLIGNESMLKRYEKDNI